MNIHRDYQIVKKIKLSEKPTHEKKKHIFEISHKHKRHKQLHYHTYKVRQTN